MSVYYDIRTLIQDSLEGQITFPDILLSYIDDFNAESIAEGLLQEFMYSFDDYIGRYESGATGYGKWSKNW